MITKDQIRLAGGFDVIYADPPWSYSVKNCNGTADKHYKTTSIADLKAMPVADLAAKDCTLFMWATYPLIREALDLISAWGFEYKSIAFQWVKFYEKKQTPFFGLGRWTRGNTEPCLLATRGKPRRVHNGVSQLVIDYEPETILTAPIGQHSAKPPEAREKISQLMGPGQRLEMFARSQTPGWVAWGDEVPALIQFP